MLQSLQYVRHETRRWARARGLRSSSMVANPGGDYAWAALGRQPPKFFVKQHYRNLLVCYGRCLVTTCWYQDARHGDVFAVGAAIDSDAQVVLYWQFIRPAADGRSCQDRTGRWAGLELADPKFHEHWWAWLDRASADWRRS